MCSRPARGGEEGGGEGGGEGEGGRGSEEDEKGKKGLADVGADRIARTAEWALRLLGELRKRTDQKLPLAWEPGPLSQSSVIEVYPAATLLAQDPELKAYKRETRARESVVSLLAERLRLTEDRQEQLRHSYDELDAVVCVLAGVDFLDCVVEKPEPNLQAQAEAEGFIWFRKPVHEARRKEKSTR